MSFMRHRGTITAYRESGHFPDGAVLAKEVFEAAIEKMTTARLAVPNAEGLVRHDEGSKGRDAGNKLWGDGWAGRALMPATGQRQRQPSIREIVNRATSRHELPTGFTSSDTRR